MPTYDYECPQCGTFELFQRITEDPMEHCPTCQNKVRRLIGSGGGILFKGSGFYETDYRSEEYKQKAKAEKTAAQPAKADSKPAEKAKPAKSDKRAKSRK